MVQSAARLYLMSRDRHKFGISYTDVDHKLSISQNRLCALCICKGQVMDKLFSTFVQPISSMVCICPKEAPVKNVIPSSVYASTLDTIFIHRYRVKGPFDPSQGPQSPGIIEQITPQT